VAAPETGYDRAGRVVVSLEHLGNMSTSLDHMRSEQPPAIAGVKAAVDLVATGGNKGGSALGGHLVSEVGYLTSKLARTHQAVDTNLRNVVACLEKTSRAIAEICATHRTAQERNKVTAAQLLQALRK
jgi:hypothetical protein